MKLTILGSGTDASNLPGIANRFPPGFLIEWDNEKLLLECSEGIRFRLEKVGIDYASIHHLAISHSHPDHYALPHFFQSIYNKGLWGGKHFADHELNIYGPKDLTENFTALWLLYHPDLPQMLPMPQLKFIALPESGEIKLGSASLEAFKVYHGFGKVGAVAFRLKSPSGVIAYSGDTGECEGIRQAAENADIFICECSARIGDKTSPKAYGHLNPFLVGDIAKNSQVKNIIIFHNTGLDSDEAIITECQRAGFEGEIVIAKDFQTFNL